jgi:tetratricopeptide (TPR) repeat protein
MKVVEFRPNDFNAYFNMALAKSELRDFRGAVEDLTLADMLNPSDANVFFQRGLANFNNEDYNLAIDDFSKAIDLRPEFAWAYFKRGSARIKQGFLEGAHSDLIKADRLGCYAASDLINSLIK